jgi:hypothetical protein
MKIGLEELDLAYIMNTIWSKKMIHSIKRIFLLWMMFMSTTWIYGQTINITVINQFRNKLPAFGVVSKLLKNNNYIQTATTDSMGKCSFTNLDTGWYTIELELQPYPVIKIVDIYLLKSELNLNQIIDFNVGTLELTSEEYKYFKFMDLDSLVNCKLNRIKFLDGSNKGLKKMPKKVLKMKNLLVLQLEGNQLKTLPNSLFRNKNLKLIDLRGNPIDNKNLNKYRYKRRDLVIFW